MFFRRKNIELKNLFLKEIFLSDVAALTGGQHCFFCWFAGLAAS
jgi:hypothetical protein